MSPRSNRVTCSAPAGPDTIEAVRCTPRSSCTAASAPSGSSFGSVEATLRSWIGEPPTLSTRPSFVTATCSPLSKVGMPPTSWRQLATTKPDGDVRAGVLHERAQIAASRPIAVA